MSDPLPPADEAAAQLIVDCIMGKKKFVDERGACRDGPMILLATASGKEEVQCRRCGLIMPKDRNMEYLFGFRVNCEATDEQ